MAIQRPTTAFLFLTALISGQDGTSSTYAFLAAPTLRSKYTGIILGASSLSNNNIETSTPTPTTRTSVNSVFFNPSLNSIEIDNPPNLQRILTSLSELKSGSDLRGTYLSHKPNQGSIANISHLIKQLKKESGGIASTPFAAHCFGAAFARWLLLHQQTDDLQNEQHERPGKHGNALTICIGRDPRVHGERLADAFARGAESVDGGTRPVRVVYTGVATTPSMFEFVRADKCDAAVMVTASNLEEMNGIKFFSKNGGLTKENIDELIALAQEETMHWYGMGILPPSSGYAGVLCSELVDFMPYYKETLSQAIIREVGPISSSSISKPLSNINIIVNPGNGAGCFFDDLLRDLGANVAGSIHLTPDGTFPDTFGVPNPEKKSMVEETTRACEANNADIGVMFDTDVDRAGFVLPRFIDKNGIRSGYEPLNGNRMIALISAIFSSSSPGCTIVTDSTTSERLHEFLENKLGLHHYRYVRGYANVIVKAEELTESGEANAEVAIEISGHCAMKENGYVHDGAYTAVKILGLLARTAASGKSSLFDLISDFDEMPYEEEMRIQVTDGSLDTTTSVFQQLAQSLKDICGDMEDWSLDEDNLEGVRVRLSSGGHFMIRQSLHDLVISMQVESISREEAREKVLEPLLSLLSKHDTLDYSVLENERMNV